MEQTSNAQRTKIRANTQMMPKGTMTSNQSSYGKGTRVTSAGVVELIVFVMYTVETVFAVDGAVSV